MYIPKDTILLLSGISCVGKTTTAYEILKRYPEFRRVSELDIIRSVVRVALEEFASEEGINKECLIGKYKSLFESLTDSDLETAKKQSRMLIPYVKEIVLRQQRRKIPTIIEGAGIIPSVFFPNDQPLNWLTDKVIFINLYLPDEDEHTNRRQLRSLERDYGENIIESKSIVKKARTEKNRMLHTETAELSRHFPNVFSIDISNRSPLSLVDAIMLLISEYFTDNLHT